MKTYMWVMAVMLAMGAVSQICRFVSGNMQKTRKEIALDLILGIGLLIWTAIILATK